MPTFGDWIQPDDVDYESDLSDNTVATLVAQTHRTGTQPGSDPFPYTEHTDSDVHTDADIGVSQWNVLWDGDTPPNQESSAAFVLLVNPQAVFGPATPDFPPGALDIEYETDIGFGPGFVIPAEQTLATHATTTAGPTVPFSGGMVLRMPAADIPAAGVVLQIGDLSSLMTLETLNAGGDPADPVEQDLALTAPPGDAFVFIDNDQLAQVLGEVPSSPPDGAGALVTISGVVLSGTYTPSRYRFVFAGHPYPLRQRQLFSHLAARQRSTLVQRQDRRWT